MNPSGAAAGMRRLPGGRFLMGADRFYPEERPRRPAEIGAFRIDEAPVTNAMFQDFVHATGHCTQAEQATGATLLFRRTDGPVDLGTPANWWHLCPGTDWRHPYGPDSSLAGVENHPVVHVAWEDAAAYAAWAGKALPTEAEWEYAARGGLADADYAWGDDPAPEGEPPANIWQGAFPWRREGKWERTSPVREFPPNGFGLYDMIGNVWEWTADRFGTADGGKPACCVGSQAERFVIKGGSHLCAESYCQRYRPAARQGADGPTSHIGFRCVIRG